MKELVINSRKQDGVHASMCINGAEVEIVESFTFLGINITNLPWSNHIEATTMETLMLEDLGNSIFLQCFLSISTDSSYSAFY